MSGVVNSAGAKSGVIGTTELEYEEGTWTPSHNGGSGTINSATYVRIGNMVTLHWKFTASATFYPTPITGAPFTATSNSAGCVATVGMLSNVSDTSVFGWLRMDSGSTNIYFNDANINTVGTPQFDSGAYTAFAISYETS